MELSIKQKTDRCKFNFSFQVPRFLPIPLSSSLMYPSASELKPVSPPMAAYGTSCPTGFPWAKRSSFVSTTVSWAYVGCPHPQVKQLWNPEHLEPNSKHFKTASDRPKYLTPFHSVAVLFWVFPLCSPNYTNNCYSWKQLNRMCKGRHGGNLRPTIFWGHKYYLFYRYNETYLNNNVQMDSTYTESCQWQKKYPSKSPGSDFQIRK